MSSEYYEGLGVTPRELVPGTVVMVPVGRGSAIVNGHACVIAWAVVRGAAGFLSASGARPLEEADSTDPAAQWWLDVYTLPGGEPLPQMYRAGEILGVPAWGLSMHGAPVPDVVIRDS